MSVDLELWAQRLRTIAPELLVGGAAEATEAIEKTPARMPAVYLVYQDDSAEPNRLDAGGHRQRITARIGALIAVRNVIDSRGANAQQATQPIVDRLDQAFLAWSPDSENFDPCEYVRGSLASFNNNVIWWICIYQTRFYKKR